MSGGTGELKLRFKEGRYRRLPLTACSRLGFDAGPVFVPWIPDALLVNHIAFNGQLKLVRIALQVLCVLIGEYDILCISRPIECVGSTMVKHDSSSFGVTLGNSPMTSRNEFDSLRSVLELEFPCALKRLMSQRLLIEVVLGAKQCDGNQ
jgi:hypothetical protein